MTNNTTTKEAGSCCNRFPVVLFIAMISVLLPGTASTAGTSLEQGQKSAMSTEQAGTAIPAKGSPAEREPSGYLINRPAMGLGLTYEFKEESRSSAGSTTTDTYHRFKERIRFETDGWVYHPALAQYSLMIEPEWIQAEETRTPGDSARIDSFSPDYLLKTVLLGQKPYTVSLFAGRREIPVWSAFAGNTETRLNSYGSSLALKYKILPTSLGYDHLETEQSGFYTSQSVRDTFNLSSRHQNRRSNTTLASTYSDDARTTEDITTRIKSFNNTLNNVYKVREDNKVRLNSTVTYRNQETTRLNTDNLRVNEHLNWQHRKNLQSNYSFHHSRQDADGNDSSQTGLQARLSHLLYENLTTNTGARSTLSNYDDGQESSVAGFLDFDYSRPLPWGTINVNSGWDYQYSWRSGFENTTAQITGEIQTLGTGNETYLDNENVDRDSIIVTDIGGTIVYIEGIDYDLSEIDNSIRINRLPFGAISDGQAVAVNYRYLRDPAYDDTLLTENYGISLDILNDWNISYSYLKVTQDIVAGQGPQSPVDDTVQHARLRYTIPWSDTSLSWEDSDRQSDLSYWQWKFQETLYFRPIVPLYFTLKGYIGSTEYKKRQDTRDFYGGVTTLDWVLNRRCKVRLEGYWDDIKGDFEETTNNGAKIGIELRYRIWKTVLSYEMTNQDNRMNDYQRKEQLVRLELIRIMW